MRYRAKVSHPPLIAAGIIPASVPAGAPVSTPVRTPVSARGIPAGRSPPAAPGAGGSLFDDDRDGAMDLFLVNAKEWPGHETLPTPPVQALYRNDGSGHFEDVTAAAGLAVSAYGMGMAIGDYDGDGWDDLFLTTLHGNRLFRNRGGHFEEVTAAAGVAGGDTWSASALFFDDDHDGDLDLFVVNDVQWSRAIDLEIDFRLTGLGRAYGAPLNFLGTHNRLYRNEGDGRFIDVSATAGIEVFDPVSGQPVGKGLGVIALDYDRQPSPGPARLPAPNRAGPLA